jgi:hypothetical protein
MVPSWLRWFGHRSRPAPRTRGAAPRRRGPALLVEALEDRTLMSTLAPLTAFDPTLPSSDSTGGLTDAMTSSDGCYTAFTSTAPNLVDNQIDTGVASNVFLLNRCVPGSNSATVTLVSHVPGLDATGADNDSYGPRISADGRFIVYESTAGDLVTGQAGPLGQGNVFLYDTTTGINTLISHRFDSTVTAGNEYSTTQDTTGFGFGPNATEFFLFSSNATDLLAGQHGPSDLNLFLYDTATGKTTLVSHNVNDPLQGANDATEDADLTPDGSSVVFESFGTDVVSGQTATNKNNIFLYDTATNSSQLISGVFVSPSGNSPTDGAGFSFQPSISADGRIIAYVSQAANLVAKQTPSAQATTENVFAYDTVSGTTTLASYAAGQPTVTGDDNSAQAVVSSDGSTIAFLSNASNLTLPQANNTANVFVYQALGPTPGTLTLVSHVSGQPNTAAGGVIFKDNLSFGDLSLSADGRFVSYQSGAANLAAMQPPNPSGADNVFLYDAQSGQNTLVSQANDPKGPPASGDQPSLYSRISADGSSIVFLSYATNLDPANPNIVDSDQNLFAYDPGTPAGTRPGPFLESTSAFTAQATTLVDDISADGRFVVFTTNDLSVVPGQVTDNFGQNVFLLDQTTGAVTLVSHMAGQPAETGDFQSTNPVLSADGDWVAFVSRATDLVAGEGGTKDDPVDQVYLFNRLTGEVTLVSHDSASATTVASEPADNPVISGDGRYVAYDTSASDLVPGFTSTDTGVDVSNVYLYDRVNNGTNTLVSHTPASPLFGGQNSSFAPAISADGRFVAYESQSTNLVAGGGVAPTDNVYLFDRTTGSNALVSHTAASVTTSPTAGSSGPVLSPDGGFVAFVSFAGNLVPGQQPSRFTNVFVYDNRARVSGQPNPAYGTNRLVSGAGGSTTVPATGFSDTPAPNEDGSRVAFRSDAPDVVTGQSGPAGSNIFEFNTQAGTQTLVSHAAGLPTTTAAGQSEWESIDGAGDLVVYLSTATNLVPGQQDTGAQVQNVFLYSADLDANALISGQDGSPFVPSTAPTYNAIISQDPVVAFNSAANLFSHTKGTSVAYINRLVQVALVGNAVGFGSPPDSTVGSLSVVTVFEGQYRPPQWSLAPGSGDDGLFEVVPGGTLLTQFQASSASQAAYQVRVGVNIGFGNYFGTLQVFGAAPDNSPPPPPPHRPIFARMGHRKVGKRKQKLEVQVFYADTGAEKAAFLSPYQQPAYRNIQVSVLPGAGGAPDEVLVTARKRRRSVSKAYPQ